MFTEERHKKIIDIVNKEKSISVKELTNRLAFSPATIRSDLNLLNNQGLLIRTHGGATSIEENADGKSLNINFSLREREHPTEKVEIAKKAIQYVKENSCIILDASSTALELGKLINNSNMRLMVLTNGLNVSKVLKNNNNITTILIGGVVQGNSNAIQGTLGDTLLKKLNVDVAFVSAHAFNLKDGLTDFNLYEVELKQLMVEHAKKVFALIDHSKLDKSSIATFGNKDDIDCFITDSKGDPQIIKNYKNEGLFVL